MAEWLFQDAPTLLAVLDKELLCRQISRGWRARLGLTSAGDGSTVPLSEMFLLDHTAGLADQLRDVLPQAISLQDIPVSLVGKNGVTQGLLSAWPIRSESGSTGICLAVTCNTDLHRALDELRHLRTMHELILNAAGEGIYGLDSNGKATFGNAATMEILGWKPEEVIGKRAHDVHHHSHPDGSPYPHTECPIYAALRDGEVHRVDEEVFWHVDGSPVPVEYTSTPIRQGSEIQGAVVVFRDISERKEIERQREAAFQEIKQLKEQLELERDYLRDEIKTGSDFGEIIGSSAALQRTMAQIDAVAATPANVLILGESGVGKEMVARAIHDKSERADKPLVKVNCASIPKELFESEFFGHVKGAFTGAHRDRVGRLQLADGGTVFLDEVGEIPPDLQGKLLRALQEREFERVGDDRTIKVDVRVVAATNRDLEAEVKAGRFREDLYYRLGVFPILVPPLRDRREDIGPLAEHFLTRTCADLGREPMRLSKQQAQRLMSHRWPGNIRELRNVIERAVILSSGNRARLDLAMPENPDTPPDPLENSIPTEEASFLTDTEMREQEKANLIAALRHANWRVWGPGGAAGLVGIKPSTLTYRMKVLGITKPKQAD
ncbi:MAG: sigma 54-interacting transcriptional regulator [gamma proteobacterium endosymbiont of Lamellibrachia anaximandri]|nr:sigma 54-interacting transcriptional regulator [gamma proteobacterium endosymbiont of Lamellibrachia anaximandri]MBL3535380.1 sigma 54-interacting transcriptional regulator [gamma proteobacterium endosymbiont of Lamellibrachia anaximandri]